LGSEDQLVVRYGVSRPTLRQAAALVGQEQLLVVRRGVGGGYFARHPDAKAVSHMASIYLQSHATRFSEIIRSMEPIKTEMTMLSAENRDPTMLALWRDFQARDLARPESDDYQEFLKWEREASQLLGRACGNHVLELFMLTLLDFCEQIRPEQDLYRDRPDRMQEFRRRRMAMVSAIVDGDAEIAALAARRCIRMVGGWMVADLEDQSGDDYLQLSKLIGA
jgi:DNA-binding FadR family transcriptional regulator